MNKFISNLDDDYLKALASCTQIQFYLYNNFNLLKNYTKQSLVNPPTNILKHMYEYPIWHKNRKKGTAEINYVSMKENGIIGGINLAQNLNLVAFIPYSGNRYQSSITELKDLDIIRIREALRLIFKHFFGRFPKLTPDQTKTWLSNYYSNDNKKSISSINHKLIQVHQQSLMCIKNKNNELYYFYMKKFKNMLKVSDLVTKFGSINNWLIAETSLYCQEAQNGGLGPDDALNFKAKIIKQISNSTNITDPVSYMFSVGKIILDHIGEEKNINNYLVRKVNMYLYDHIKSKISIEKLSKFTGYSKDYLMSTYKHQAGVTIIQFFNKIKIDSAKNHLLFTNDSVSKTADYFNFSSPNYFSAVFKKYTGETPYHWQLIRRVKI